MGARTTTVRVLTWCAALLVAAAPGPALADEADVTKMSDIEDASLEGLMNLDLEDQLGATEAVSRTSESILRAPATVTTLDARQIRLSGARNVPEVLRAVPGVAVIRNAPGNYVVSIRGMGGLASNNIILLVDGIPLNNPLDGTVSWDLLPVDVEDIERIEVVRGPVSPAYGANAYVGVINIVTKASLGLTPSYAARARGGADVDGAEVGSVSGRFVHIGERLELKWFLSAEHDQTSATLAEPSASGEARAAPLDRATMLLAVTHKSSERSSLKLELGQSWSRRSGMDHLALDAETQSQRLLFGGLSYELRGLAASKDSVKLWAQGLSLDTSVDDAAVTGFSYDGANSLRGAFGGDWVVPLIPALSLNLGAQASIERIRAPFVHPDLSGEARPSYGFYAGAKAAGLFDAIDLGLTLRGDLAPISAKLEYSYRASAVYYTDVFGIWLSAASAFRTPTYVEAAGRFTDRTSNLILLEGTDSIAAPRNTTVELGGTFLPRSGFMVSPTVFVSRLGNLMIEDFEPVVRRTFRTEADTRTYVGAELEATWHVSDVVKIFPSVTHLRFLDARESLDTNVAVPSQNSRYLASLRMKGLFDNETWGYGIGASVASSRDFNVRTGIPPRVLRKRLPTTAHVSAMLEHQVLDAPSLWTSLRVSASIPGDAAESPLPNAAATGQSAVLGFEIRRE